MFGLMQDWPLLLHKIIDHAALQHGTREVVTRSVEGPIHRTDYATIRNRALRCAKRLAAEGVGLGDRVATLAWNSWRHVEAWYGITGIGAICHTVNPRLFPEQICWIVNHAEDRLMMVDLTFVPLLERLADRLTSVERYIVLTDEAHMPATSLRNAIAYDTWLAEADADFHWAALDERTAAGLCYTSGTTGRPRGVLYSHRSNVLHAWQASSADALCAGMTDSMLVIVPMFHANAWANAFCLPMTGAKMVLPGARLDGASVFQLMEDEDVTISAGVPTVWSMLLQTMAERGRKPPSLRKVAVGGSACPRSMVATFERDWGIEVFHAWGMTETSPLGTIGTVKPTVPPLAGEALWDMKAKQGSAPFGVEMALADDDGRPLPWNGDSVGRLKVRGPCVARAYYGEDDPAVDADGWFDTGDIATIDPDGTMHITDRAKDIVKSGGEWISSVEIETIAVGHPDLIEAAVIGVPHVKWGERPLLVVTVKPGRAPRGSDLLVFLEGKIARWWLPDDVLFLETMPHNATGKIDKRGLRQSLSNYRWPGAVVDGAAAASGAPCAD